MRLLITGGCGFIGCNAASRFKSLGHDVTVLDNLSRPGSGRNLEWLKEGGDIRFEWGDVRDAARVGSVVREGRYGAVIHLAGQVAVTTSVVDPRTDFEVNASGTLNVLEAVRSWSPDSIVLFSSTNKVYGKLGELRVLDTPKRCTLPDLPDGVGESQPLDFHSPYGCSKGAADQYIVDYARIYGLRTVNFRQSCIYGTRQLGVEDQGWVAWFAIAHMLGRPITIYGTGKQVRDVLFIDDLLDCYAAAIERIESVAGTTFNIGGGPSNTLSLLEFVELLEQLSGRPVKYGFADWRAGDQPVYISRIERAEQLLGWRPRTGVTEGVDRLNRWIAANRSLIETSLRS